MSDREKELLARIEKLEAKEREREAQTKAPVFVPEPAGRRYDPTENMSLPPAARAEMVALGDRVCADIIGDSRRSTAPSAIVSPAGPQHSRAAVGRNGWVDARPLPASPPGQRYVDAQLDAADVVDQRERIRKGGAINE